MTDKCPCKMTYDITDQLAAAALDLDSRQPQEIIELLEKAKITIEALRGYRDEAEAHAAIADMVVSKFRLTGEEREAIKEAADSYDDGCNERCREMTKILRGLLERLGGAQCTS